MGVWGEHYPVCAESRQSPIDIDTRTTAYSSTLTPFQFLSYDKTPDYTQFDINNNGHTGLYGGPHV